MPPLPEIQEAGRRERLIREELSLGFLGQGQGIDGTSSMFASEEECREAWGRHAAELTAEYVARGLGDRPDAWWRFVAGRLEYLSPCRARRGRMGW